jgi:hypothetical protein
MVDLEDHSGVVLQSAAQPKIEAQPPFVDAEFPEEPDHLVQVPQGLVPESKLGAERPTGSEGGVDFAIQPPEALDEREGTLYGSNTGTGVLLLQQALHHF